MQRGSQDEQDGVVWSTASVDLGRVGLDLRTPSAPGSLVKLLNARFRDEKTLERRRGHRGVLLRDNGAYSVLNTPEEWVYGHGQRLTTITNVIHENTHYPIPRQGRGTFRFGDSDMAWTGDRLFAIRHDGAPAIGGHTHWSRGAGILDYGIPAYLPAQTDSTPPDVITGDYVETCLTTTLRVFVASTSSEDLIAWVVDRTTGAVVNKTTIVTAGTAIRDPRVVNSNDEPVLVWRDDTNLRISWWSGTAWSSPSVISGACDLHEVYPFDSGFYLAWSEGGDINIGHYRGHGVDGSDFDFGSTLGLTITGAFAFAVAPDRGLVFVYQNSADDDKLYATTCNANLDNAQTALIIDVEGPYDSGLTVTFRGLYDATNRYPFVVHAGNGELWTKIVELDNNVDLVQSETRYRTHVASKSFRVGDEVFCWLRARNSQTHYLAGGVTMPQVSGIADREEAPARQVNDGVRALPLVTMDPLDPHRFTWIRPFTPTRVITINDESGRVAETYKRAGNARTGDINFLPQLSTARYGRSVYLASSHVRNWDGIELGDAGFHDYPIIEGFADTEDGFMTPEGVYGFRVYPVRYNKLGERFQGPAVSASVTLGVSADATVLTINTVPCTNHDDVVFEVYRTENGGTTFYLDGTVDNSLSAATVQYTSTNSDAVLRGRAGDPHAPGIGVPAIRQSMGPAGCTILCASGDRLWGAGGQVPAGTVQFSKLKEPGAGAGFDALSGTQEIDLEGGVITSLVGMGDGFVTFERDRIYVLFGSGPNNYGAGAFGIPQLSLADGATTHFGTVMTQLGAVYWAVDGPRLLNHALKVENISLPVRLLTETLTPSGVQADLTRQEVVWYTEAGDAVLLNYESGARWAQWSGLPVAGCSNDAIVAPDGVMLYEDEAADGDNGRPYQFAFATSELHPEEILQGATHLRRVGITGEYLDEHELRFRVYFDGAPLWSEEFSWSPATETYLVNLEEVDHLTPAQFDALKYQDHSGRYGTHRRVRRGRCDFFRIEVSDVSSGHKTYLPYELVFELGRKPGLGRTAVNTFN